MGIFKAYDIRGIAPDELDTAAARHIGWAFAAYLRELAEGLQDATGRRTPSGATGVRIVLGRDARITSDELAGAFVEGANAAGASVIDAGLCTTPMLYCAVGALERDQPGAPAVQGGAMVTASHNGARYNGFKLCGAGARPIGAETGLKRIEELAASAPRSNQGEGALARAEPYPELAAAAPVPPPAGVSHTLWNRYWAHVARFKRRWPGGVRAAIDPANGMGGLYIPILRGLGLECVTVNERIDGTFPAHEANPLKEANLADLRALMAREKSVTLGIAIDGDADRVVFLDEHARTVPSDLLTAALARELLLRQPGAAVVCDVRSSRVVADTVRAAGGRHIRERVGHSYMKAALRECGGLFGGELSGHFYYCDSFVADSSIVTVIEVLNMLGLTGKTLGEIIEPLRRYRQSGEINFTVPDKEGALALLARRFPDGRQDRLDGLTVDYDTWWFNVRLSNTEPLLRLNVEASSQSELDQRVGELRAVLAAVAQPSQH